LSEWLKFFLIRLPLALFTVGLVVQAASWLLAGITLHRHNVDDLANAVMHDTRRYSVVLLGDSVTHNVAHKYRIGDVDEVADLTTHAFAGLPSSLFLLKRYLESGHRPQHVVLAASRGVFVNPMYKPMFKYYVGSVFTFPYEREFLRTQYSGYMDRGWRPAALSMTTNLGEPLFSLIRRPGNDIWQAPETPSLHPALEGFPNDVLAYDQEVVNNRISGPAVVRPEVQAILKEFCELSHRYGFSLHIIWAPVEPHLHRAWKLTGKMQSINEQLAEIFKGNQTVVSIDDVVEQQEYLYFDRDLIHIRGLGWEQRYANQLTSYIHEFKQQGKQQISTPN
jgi:hypothetical protein